MKSMPTSEQLKLYPEVEPIARKYGFEFHRSFTSGETSLHRVPFDSYLRRTDELNPQLTLNIVSSRASGRSDDAAVEVAVSGSFYHDTYTIPTIYVPVEEIIKRIEEFGQRYNLQRKDTD